MGALGTAADWAKHGRRSGQCGRDDGVQHKGLQGGRCGESQAHGPVG